VGCKKPIEERKKEREVEEEVTFIIMNMHVYSTDVCTVDPCTIFTVTLNLLHSSAEGPKFAE
jgi:hypothetical protein